MNAKSISVPLAAVLGLLAVAPAPAGELVPIRHLSLSASDGSVLGELVVYLRRPSGPEDEPLADVVQLETGGGDRARLISYREDETEIYVHRFEDHSSGWEAAWRLDSGLDNLGDPADYYDPFDWLIEVIERSEKQLPISHLAIETSDGVVVEWQEPGAPSANREEAEQAKLDALARLAVALAEQPLPESTQRALHVLHLFRRGEGGDELSGFDGLIEALTTALRAARGEERGARGEGEPEPTNTTQSP